MHKNIKDANIHNIGCSLWSKKTFEFLKENCGNKKTKEVCILQSNNPTKNFRKTVDFCKLRKLNYEPIYDNDHLNFLKKMSNYESFLFLPTVLETYSRVCAEAKMLNLKVMTNKNMIGFFSEEYSPLSGIELIKEIELKNKKALEFFEELV